MLLNANRLGDLRRSTLSWCRRTRISASNAARDRNSPIRAHQINLQRSLIGSEYQPIRGRGQPFWVCGRDNRSRHGSPIGGQRQSVGREFLEGLEPEGEAPGEPRKGIGFAEPTRHVRKQRGRESKDGVLQQAAGIALWKSGGDGFLARALNPVLRLKDFLHMLVERFVLSEPLPQSNGGRIGLVLRQGFPAKPSPRGNEQRESADLLQADRALRGGGLEPRNDDFFARGVGQSVGQCEEAGFARCRLYAS
jgi:hypothetical protein